MRSVIVFAFGLFVLGIGALPAWADHCGGGCGAPACCAPVTCCDDCCCDKPGLFARLKERLCSKKNRCDDCCCPAPCPPPCPKPCCNDCCPPPCPPPTLCDRIKDWKANRKNKGCCDSCCPAPCCN